MNKLLHSLTAFGALFAFSFAAHAQVPIKIAVIDIAKIYDNHYETIQQNAKLKVDTQRAQDQIDQMNKEGQALVEQYKEYVDEAKNPTATPEAKSKSEAEARDKAQEIQSKEKEISDVANSAKQEFQQRIQNFRTAMMQTISTIATDVAKRDGYTILIDKSGPTLIGIAPVIYADPSYDITDQVMAEINKNRPHTEAESSMPPAPAAPAPSSGGSDAAPKIVLPGISPQ